MTTQTQSGSNTISGTTQKIAINLTAPTEIGCQ